MQIKATSMDSVANVKDAPSSNSYCDIDPRLYEAATEGDIKPFKENKQYDLHLMVTPLKNTILHIHVISSNQITKSTEFVKQLIKICPPLQVQVNANGDSPLHVAARSGQSGKVKVLIESAKAPPEELESGPEAAKQMLRMTNNEGNTALHDAVGRAHLDVVKILTKEDPEFSYSANHYGETPLFLAAAVGSVEMVAEILETCKSPAHGGPDGKTALHAAVMNDDTDSIEKLLKRKNFLTKEIDRNGWTPLHYAAYYGSWAANRLIEADKSAAYIVDKNRKMTALHMAAGQGYKTIMEEIIFHCPDCCEMVDDQGWNVLHFAMIVLNFNELRNFLTFLDNKKLQRSLLRRRDVNGNTPLHVLAACRPVSCREMPYEFLNFFWDGNKQNDTVMDILLYPWSAEQLQQKIKKLSKVVKTGPYRRGIIRRLDRWNERKLIRLGKTKESHLIVATLIATVTFAAAFTMPGGYENEKGLNEGTAILSRKAAFQTFVITDGIAMIFSLFAILIHFVISMDIFEYMYLFKYTTLSTVIAMGAMVVSFVTGTYAVLTPSLGLAIANCCIGLSFFGLVIFLLYKISSPNAKLKSE